MSDIIWQPDPDAISASRIAQFTSFVADRHQLALPGYAELHAWSTENLGDFWQSVWDFFAMESTTEPGPR
ncbi:hypothetical protein [Sciscionella marina]|uniref:hypothetical protein n=1 Tax=Sciscionella marina TaxID=508770 RepID=UPI0003666C8F|nr:hypothetical protein [Sciscionella marina]